MTTRITVPLFAIRHMRIGGAESSIYNFTRGLAGQDVALGVALSRGDYLAGDFDDWIATQPVRVTRLPTLGKRLSARFAEEGLFGLLATPGHVLYPNYFLPPVRRQSGLAAAIVNDSQYRVFPEYFPAGKRRWLEFNYRRTMRHADRVFFISHFERRQAIRFFGDRRADRYRVIGAAIDMRRYRGGEPDARIAALTARPFILSVAHQHRHKNVETLVRAFAELASSVADVRLVLVGVASPGVQAIVAELPDPIRRRIVLTGFISDGDLGHLYRGMALFALPSRYEGFGMPAVEALAHDRPVVVADAGALREVTQDMASYVPDGASASQWASALREGLGKRGAGPARIAELLAFHSPATVAGNIVTGFD